MDNGIGFLRRTVAANWRSAGVAFLLVLVFALHYYHFLQNHTSFNSDQLYCIHFCDDFLHGRDVQGFHMPAAPYIFPDMVLMALCTLLTSNIAVLFLLYGLSYYGLLLFVLSAIGRQLGLLWSEAFQIAGLGLALLWACHFDPAYADHAGQLCYPGNHMGILLVGLAVTALIPRAVQHGYRWPSAILLVGMGALSGGSDQLLIVQYLAPVGVAVLILGICRLVPYRRVLVTLALLGLASVLAMKMRHVLIWLGFVPMHITHKDAIFQRRFIDTFHEYLTSWQHITQGQTLRNVVIIFHAIAAAATIGIWSRRVQHLPAASSRLERPSVLLIALVLLLAPLSTAAVLIATGSVEPGSVSRYQHTWWFVPLMGAVLWSRLLPGRLARFLPAMAVVVVAFRVFTFPEPLRFDRLTPRYPPLARALDEMVRKHGPLRGFAEFWQAREMHYLTQERVAVVPIMKNGSPRFHAYNPNCFLSDDPSDTHVPDYHFVIFPAGDNPDGPDPEQIMAHYGKPLEIIPAEEYTIWRYECMRNRQFDLFLRSQVAQRLVRHNPLLVPSEPTALRTPKRNLTPWEKRGNIQLQRSETLTVRFEKPVKGAMIDVSANYSDAYQMLFLRDGKELDMARVPAMGWTGADLVYCMPGLQSRLVPVPAACRLQGFDEVRLIPTGRSSHFTVGHFLVLDSLIPFPSGTFLEPEPYHRYEGEKMHRMQSAEVTEREEASASNGRYRQATASYQGHLAYGPYTLLAPGRYRVDFALKVADNQSSEIVAAIDCSAFMGEQILQTRTLRGRDFSAAGQYQICHLTFETEDELDLVEFRVFVTGKTAVTLDYVDVTRLPPAASEVCEP